MGIIGEAKVSKKFQITLPKAVRLFLNIKEGDKIVFVVENNKLFVKKENEES